MFDSDKFIECVRCRPTLWDTRLQHYNDKAERDRAWADLGADMYADEWATVDADQADRKVKEMKSKWRNIRDNYLKYINQFSHGAPKKKRKYVYAEKLAFLQNTIGKRKIVTRQGDAAVNEVVPRYDENEEYNINRDSELGDEYAVDYDEEDISAKMISPNTSSDPAAPMCLLDLPPDASSFARTPSSAAEEYNAMSPFQVDVMKRLDALKKPDREEDPDKSFLMSILPDYRKLTEEEKLDFRINCLHFFRDVKNTNGTARRKH